MMKKSLAIGADIGGTHITCAAVILKGGNVIKESLFRVVYDHEASAEYILYSWATALNNSISTISDDDLAGIGFAIPGPFDYKLGLSKMQHKFKHLYNIDIPTALNKLLDKQQRMRFINDATAFAMGEAWHGSGKSYKKVVVITLGTGFGSAFLNKGIPVVSGTEVPKEGCLWHLAFKNGIADDYFSTRWFATAYEKKSGLIISGVKELAYKASSDPVAREIFQQFGQNLAECLSPWLKLFDAEILIIGGNIAHNFQLFEGEFRTGLQRAGVSVQLALSALMEDAALLGSARLQDDDFWQKISAHLPAI